MRKDACQQGAISIPGAWHKGADRKTMTTPDSIGSPGARTRTFPDDRRHSAGNVYTNVRRRRSERAPLKPMAEGRAYAVAHGVGASALLVAGTIWTLKQQKPKYVKPGELLQLPASLVVAPPPVTEQVFSVSSVLRRYTKDTVRANRIAQALITEGGKRNLDPALLIGVLLTENAKLDPQARSNVSARGLMQVMPFHAGKWKAVPVARSRRHRVEYLLRHEHPRGPREAVAEHAARAASLQRLRARDEHAPLPHVLGQSHAVRGQGRVADAGGSFPDVAARIGFRARFMTQLGRDFSRRSAVSEGFSPTCSLGRSRRATTSGRVAPSLRATGEKLPETSVGPWLELSAQRQLARASLAS